MAGHTSRLILIAAGLIVNVAKPSVGCVVARTLGLLMRLMSPMEVMIIIGVVKNVMIAVWLVVGCVFNRRMYE